MDQPFHLGISNFCTQFRGLVQPAPEKKQIENPERWGDLSQLHIHIKPKSQFEFVPRDTEEFKFNQNLNSNCTARYRGIWFSQF